MIAFGECLHDPFLAVARAYPRRVALSWGEHDWTYGELEDRSRRAAAVLMRERRPGTSSLVAIIGRKTPESVVGILGALRAGYGYSTLAPSSPRLRIEAALRVLRPEVVVMTSLDPSLREELRGITAPVGKVLDLAGDLPTDAFLGVPRLVLGDGAPLVTHPAGPWAYVLFTSGSTGHPKGVCVSHHAARTAVDAFLRNHPLTPADCVGNQVELCFDLSMFDLFAALSSGARLRLIPPAAAEPDCFWRCLASWGVTSLFTVPSVVDAALRQRSEDAASVRLRQLLLSGELLRPDFVARLRQHLPRSASISNLYGGTEMPYVLARCLDDVDPAEANTFPSSDAPVHLAISAPSGAAGQIGELVVSGDAIYSGYLRGDGAPEAPVVHRTGDLVRRGDNGEITMLGRLDRQVKIDGVRVELDAIEHVLESHASVLEAAVIPSIDRLEIIGVVALRGGGESPAALEAHCRARLDPIECPSRFVSVPALPRTPSGKRDRQRLLEWLGAGTLA